MSALDMNTSRTIDDEGGHSKRTDPGWKYATLKDKNNTNNVTCMFCNKETKGGIHRHKVHLAGGSARKVSGCKEVPPEVKKEMIDSLESKKVAKSYASSNNIDPFDNDILGDDASYEDQCQNEVVCLGGVSGNSGSGAAKRKGTMCDFFPQANRNQKKPCVRVRQTTIDETLDPGKVQYATQCIAKFFYQAGIAFNAARLESFKKMIHAVGECPGMKPPSYHDLRVPLLDKEVKNTEERLETHRKEWELTGCTLMCDGWTDRRNRSLVNFLVNSPRGTVFLDTVDTSSYSKTGARLFELMSKFIERIGPKNVIQVVTDNGSNFVLAGM